MSEYATKEDLNALEEKVENPPSDIVEGWFNNLLAEHVAAGNQFL